ncbi:hypothetical protein DLM46_35915 [Paraburkholderia lacunae]|uniref:Uncharacterized protein n=1 Tax=Paraburkholderia lacunae TaxID=2211104 RepID=A0A370MWV5_9BURK|nr:hypothetical protein DLM46_35915 [Paraburkholderia lacunae]
MARAGQDGLTRIVLPPGACGRPARIRAARAFARLTGLSWAAFYGAPILIVRFSFLEFAVARFHAVSDR